MSTTTLPKPQPTNKARSRTAARTRRTVNVRLLLATLLIVGVGLPAAWFWYQRSVDRTADAMLARATALEAEKKWSEATEYLQRYLLLRPGDDEAPTKLAQAYGKVAESPRQRLQLIAMIYRALGRQENDDLRLQLADSLLETGQFKLAHAEAEKLLKRGVHASAAKRIRGLSLFGQTTQDDPAGVKTAIESLNDAVTVNPADVRLAMITAAALRRHADRSLEGVSDNAARADAIVDELVKASPGSAAALLARYQYKRQYGLPGGDSDLDAAAVAAPEDVEVLLLLANRAASGASPNLPRAEAALRQTIKLAPLDSRGYLGMASLLSNRGKHREAATILRQGQNALEAKDLDIIMALAQALLDAGEIDDAASVVTEVARETRDRAPEMDEPSRRRAENWTRILEARVALQQGRIEAAITQLQPLAASATTEQSGGKSRETLVALELLARTMASQNRWDVAAQYFDELASWLGEASSGQTTPTGSAPGRAAALVRAGEAYLRAGQPDEAVARFDRLPRDSQSDPAVLVMSVQAHLAAQLRRPAATRNWTELESLLTAARAKLPEQWELLGAEAEILLAQGGADSYQRVAELLAKSESRFEKSNDYWRAMAIAYQRLKQPENLSRALGRFDELEPSATTRSLLRATLAAHQGDFQQAAEVLRAAEAAATPEERRQLQRVRLALMMQGGQAAEANLEVAKLVNEATQDREMLTAAAEIALAAKDYAGARKWEAQLRQFGEGYEWRYLHARRLLEEFATLDPSGRNELATLVKSLSVERPRWFPTAVLYARHAELTQQFDEAVKNYELAIELGDARPETLERLVELLYRAGDFEGAEGYLARLASSAPDSERLETLAISLAVGRQRFEDAIQLARQSVERHPDQPLRRIMLAKLLADAAKPADAEAELAAAREKFPNDVQVWNGMFTFLVQQGREDEARKMLVDFVAKTAPADGSALFIVAQAHEALRELDEARKYYALAVEADPANVAIRLRYAGLLLSVDIAAARTQLQAALKQDPTNAQAKRQLATVLAATGNQQDWQQATELLEGAGGPDAPPSSVDSRLRALLLMQRGRTRDERLANYDVAQKILLDELKRPNSGATDVDRLLLAGICERAAMLRNDTNALLTAREYLRPLVDRADPPADYLKLYVEFLLRHAKAEPEASDKRAQSMRDAFLADAEGRLQDYKKKLDQQSTDSPALLTLEISLLNAQGRADEADASLDKFTKAQEALLAAGSTDDNAKQRSLLTLGNLFSSLERHEQARAWYRRLAEINPKAFVMVAKSLAAQGRYREAVDVCLAASSGGPSPEVAAMLAGLATQSPEVRDLKNVKSYIAAALDAHQDNADLLFSTGVMEVSQGRDQQAVKLFREVLRVAPDNVLTMNNLATLLAERPEGRQEALAVIGQAIEVAGRQAPLLDTQGTIQLLVGDASQAVASLEEAVAGGADDPRYLFHLAAAYEKSGQVDKAREAMASAKKQGLDKSLLTGGDSAMLEGLEKTLQQTATN